MKVLVLYRYNRVSALGVSRHCQKSWKQWVHVCCIRILLHTFILWITSLLLGGWISEQPVVPKATRCLPDCTVTHYLPYLMQSFVILWFWIFISPLGWPKMLMVIIFMACGWRFLRTISVDTRIKLYYIKERKLLMLCPCGWSFSIVC